MAGPVELGIVGVGLVDLQLFQMLLKILVGLFDHGRAQLPSLKLVDGRQQRGALGRELLRAVGTAARVGNGGDVVRAEMPLDELTCGIDDDFRSQRGDVQIVEHDHVQASADGLRVGLDVARQRRGRRRTRARGRHRNIDERKRADLLRLAVVQQLEIVLGEIADEIAALVGDDGVDVDEVDLDLERRRGCGLLLCRDDQ